MRADGSALPLKAAKQKTVLAQLLLHRDEVVSVDRLKEALWGESPPTTAGTALQGYVSQLRRMLESGAEGGASLLVTRPPGYALGVTAEQVDLTRFEELATIGREALAAGNGDRAAALLTEGLALWRGPPLADFSYEPWAQSVIGRLEELRLSALEDRIEADLAAGRGGELVGELESLIAEHPLRERLRGQLILALYRGGRQADALEAYQVARRALTEELGIEPGPELQDLNRAILNQDEALAGPVRTAPHLVRLPAALTPIIGRHEEQAELRSVFKEGARLVTITGPGGVGKTRLAIEVASGLAELFADGVVFVALASLQEAPLVPSAIANQLGVSEGADQPLLETLNDHLRTRCSLLVLDNFEHVLDAASVAAELLSSSPGLAVLATSRVPLRLYGEHEYGLEPLALPDSDRLPPTDDLACVDSVALFKARAHAADRRFELTPANAAAVAGICGRLDGLPLAIELAAAHVKLMPPEELMARLDMSLPMLIGGPTDAPERQRTVRAAIEWSHALLEERERSLFRRLAVFVGGCTLEAAQAVCDAELEGVEALIDASVVRAADVPDGERRISMLKVIREFAAEQLEASGEAETVRARQMAYLLELAVDADARMTGAEQPDQLRRVALELDNIRAALAWALERKPADALRLLTRLQRFFYLRGYSAEGLRAVETALQRVTDTDLTLEARALRSAGTFAEGIGDFTRARSYLEDGVERFRRLGDPRELGATLNNLGAVAVRQGDVVAARGYFAESLEFKRQLGDRHGMAVSLSNLGMLEARSESYEAARAHQEEACAILRELGDENALANSLTALAELAVFVGSLEEADALLREAIPLTERVADRAATVEGLALLARVWLAREEGAMAREEAARAVALATEVDDAFTTIVALEIAADVLAANGESFLAVNLRATATRIRSESDAPEGRTERDWSTETHERALASLGAADYDRARTAGATTGTQDALASAAHGLLLRHTAET